MTYKRLFHVLILLISLLGLLLPLSAQEPVTHIIKPGENLFRIALTYGVDMNELARANNIANPTRIFSGQTLVIPNLTAVTTNPASATNPLVTAPPTTHIIQRGETLREIAIKYGISVEQLLQSNSISNPNLIYAGQTLSIWSNDLSVPITEPVTVAPTPEPAPSTVSTTTHTVVAGEYLSQIARRYGVSWTRVAEANGITDPNRIYAGMKLIIPDPTASPVTNIPASTVGEPGARIGVGREIVVVLSTQATYAYENGVLQRVAIVSTGLPATPTVQGDYKIYIKYRSQTMSGPGYYLPDVPFVMYFYQGYGLHGTYWHSNFGQPMSRGCVNMRNDDAEWFYNFASVGTPVHVRWA